MSKLFNLARMTSATVGTGTATLGAAVAGYLTFALSGVANNQWVTYGIKDGANSEVGYGKYTSAGTTLTRNLLFSTTGALLNLSGAAEIYVTLGASDLPFPDNWLTGLTISNDVTSPNTVFDVAVGAAADSTNTDILRLTAGYSKSNGAWSVGSGNGGIDAGSVAANTWYHVHIIRRPDTGVVDILFSGSATAPTLPANYTQFRRIGSIRTDFVGNWITFSQFGDDFLWKNPLQDVNALNLTSTSALLTLTVPTNVRVMANFRSLYANSAAAGLVLIQSPDEATQIVNAPGGNVNMDAVAAGLGVAANFSIRTNLSAQVRAVSNNAANDVFYIVTFGWTDRRGRDG